MMLAGGLEDITDSHEINISRAQIVHKLKYFVPALSPRPTIMPDLGENGRIQFLHTLKQADGVEIARTRTNS